MCIRAVSGSSYLCLVVWHKWFYNQHDQRVFLLNVCNTRLNADVRIWGLLAQLFYIARQYHACCPLLKRIDNHRTTMDCRAGFDYRSQRHQTSLLSHSEQFWAPPNLLWNGNLRHISNRKSQEEREADNSPVFSVEVKTHGASFLRPLYDFVARCLFTRGEVYR
jgi:hypothetical protein